jgi:hypothetical protein
METTMFAWLKTITTAGNRLARTLTELSDTVAEVNAGLRAQVGLDRPGRGRKVLDHKADPAAAADAEDAA